MYSVICLGTESEVYGPFIDKDHAMNWLFKHSNAYYVCSNGIDYYSHAIDLMWPSNCRVCNVFLFHDRDNHPADISLCWKHDSIDQEAEHGLV